MMDSSSRHEGELEKEDGEFLMKASSVSLGAIVALILLGAIITSQLKGWGKYR